MQHNPELYCHIGQQGTEPPEVLGAFAAGVSPYCKDPVGSPRRAPGEPYVGPDGSRLAESPRRAAAGAGYSERGMPGDGGDGGWESGGAGWGGGAGGWAAGGGWGSGGGWGAGGWAGGGGGWGGSGSGWGHGAGPVVPYTERTVAMGADGQSPQRIRDFDPPASATRGHGVTNPPGWTPQPPPSTQRSLAAPQQYPPQSQRSYQQPAQYQQQPAQYQQQPAQYQQYQSQSVRYQQSPPSQYQQSPPSQYQQSPQQQPAQYQSRSVRFQESPPSQYQQSPPSQYQQSPPSQYQRNWVSRGAPPGSEGFVSPRSAASSAPIPGMVPVRRDGDPNLFAEEVSRRYLRGSEYDAAPAYLPPLNDVDGQGGADGASGYGHSSRSIGGGGDGAGEGYRGGAGGDGYGAGGDGAGGGRDGYGHGYHAVPVGGLSGCSVYTVGDTTAPPDYAGPVPLWAGAGATATA